MADKNAQIATQQEQAAGSYDGYNDPAAGQRTKGQDHRATPRAFDDCPTDEQTRRLRAAVQDQARTIRALWSAIHRQERELRQLPCHFHVEGRVTIPVGDRIDDLNSGGVALARAFDPLD